MGNDKFKLTDKEAAVLMCLPRGGTRKIALRELIIESKYSNRSVRNALQTLKEKGVPIVADFRPSTNTKGYFIAETEDERDVIKSYEKMGKSILKQTELIRHADLNNWQDNLIFPEEVGV